MKKIFLALMILIMIITGCKLPQSVGRPRDIVIISRVVDTALVNSNLQIVNYLPQPEPNFIFIFASDTAMNVVSKFHTLFLYGSLQHDFITTLLSPDAREATLRDSFTLFKINNLWAENQTAVILAVSESTYVEQGLRKYRKMITGLLETSYYQRLKSRYYDQGVDNQIKKALEPFGFNLKLQKGWIVDSSQGKDNFIFIHAHAPDRSIFFFKEKKSGIVTDSDAVKIRNALTRRYYNGDYILEDLTTIEPVDFNDRQGIKIKGIWQNDSLVAGGPFLSYFFQANDTLYALDGMLFLPGERKTDYFMQLEIIMNSMEIINGNTSP